jgi:hypothetical protein
MRSHETPFSLAAPAKKSLPWYSLSLILLFQSSAELVKLFISSLRTGVHYFLLCGGGATVMNEFAIPPGRQPRGGTAPAAEPAV